MTQRKYDYETYVKEIDLVRFDNDTEYAKEIVTKKIMHISHAIDRAIGYSTLEFLEWIFPEIIKVYSYADIQRVLLETFKKILFYHRNLENLEKLKWFHSLIFENNKYDFDWNIERYNWRKELFTPLAGLYQSQMNIEYITWIYELSQNNPLIIFNKQQIFSDSAQYNNIIIAKYIYELGEINIHENDNKIFKNCNFEFLKWFYELDDSFYNVDTSKFNNNYFHNIIRLEKKAIEQQKELDMLKEQVKVIPELVNIIVDLTINKNKLFKD
jgi:hypothetical protein